MDTHDFLCPYCRGQLKPNVKVIVVRSKVTGPKFHSHAHLPLIASPPAQTGHTGINTLGTATSTTIPRSRSKLQGQRSQDPSFMAIHIYPSYVVHMHKLAMLAPIPLTQQCSQETHLQRHSTKVKGHITRIACTYTDTSGSARLCTLVQPDAPVLHAPHSISNANPIQSGASGPLGHVTKCSGRVNRSA